jgi:hypothetical protein
MEKNTDVTIITPPDVFYGAEKVITLIGYGENDVEKFIDAVSVLNQNNSISLCLYNYSFQSDDTVDWLNRQVAMSSMTIINFDSFWSKHRNLTIFLGWVLSRESCFYQLDDDADQEFSTLLKTLNCNKINNALEALTSIKTTEE